MPYKDPEKGREYAREYARLHREDMKDRLYEWRKNNPEKSKAIYNKYSQSEKGKIKNRRFAKKVRLLSYGITEEDLTKLKEDQNNMCAICGIKIDESIKNLAIDHDHKNGQVRGLLCMNCNIGLGAFRDNKRTMLNAIDYLEKAKNRKKSAKIDKPFQPSLPLAMRA